jgi:pyruvate/2-oxoacid:ferredoxin oxidoreductase beta subunit
MLILSNCMQNRLNTQQKEFERQVNAVRDLYFKLQETNSEEAKQAQKQKLKDISQRHTKLRLRIDEQLRTLMKSYQPELSNEEKEWVDKLEKLSKQISGDSGYLARIKMVNVYKAPCIYCISNSFFNS